MRLRELRVLKLYSIKRLALAASVAERSVSAIESGERVPSLGTIRKLADILGVNPMEVDEFKVAMERAMKRTQRRST